MVKGFITGLITANAIEWYVHKHILHEKGKNKASFWNFHWGEHHKTARKNDFKDESYTKPLFEEWNPQSKEAAALIAGAASLLPIAPLAPGFTAGMWFSAWNYYRVHKKSHLDVEWGKKHLPWHYDHHMGKDQNKNWCVTFPLWDHVMGTREKYEYAKEKS